MNLGMYLRCVSIVFNIHANYIFNMSLNYHNKGWRRLTKRAGVVDLRWHDLRREAISRLFERGLALTEVQSISGHLTLQMLSTYTAHDAETLAIKLKKS